MAFRPVSAEDFSQILNLMGHYQHLVDSGDEEGWAQLFTEDGAFLGLGPEADARHRGREGLRQVVRLNMANGGGRFRHNICSFSAQYGEHGDEAHARYYMIGVITPPGEAPRIAIQVDVETHLLRIGGEWKIRTNRMRALGEG
ncbi:MAG: nuclear transport factor 2 family protein [Novosphingobium sp.]|nr:nuclear transport factor 2 family protein [Novosphingobium sp.]